MMSAITMRLVSRFRRRPISRVTLVLAQGFQGGRDGKAAHQLGDVVHIVGVRGDIAGAAGARRAHRLEQDGLAGARSRWWGVFFAVPGKQPVAVPSPVTRATPTIRVCGVSA